jgi:hypothetical protein
MTAEPVLLRELLDAQKEMIELVIGRILRSIVLS